jgi:hypothetical protein
MEAPMLCRKSEKQKKSEKEEERVATYEQR